MESTKKYGLITMLAASLLVNLIQFVHIHNGRFYTQFGSNFVQPELHAEHNKIALNRSCQIVGALQSSIDDVLTCFPDKTWKPAVCLQKGFVLKDDSGLTIVCDGAYWRNPRY